MSVDDLWKKATSLPDIPAVETKIVQVSVESSYEVDTTLQDAANIIRSGRCVAFPTETVYGLGANALDPVATQLIFATKRRPQDNPLIVHISDLDMLPQVAESVSERALSLMKAFWPGPLTILLPKSTLIPESYVMISISQSSVVCGQPRVGVRMPSHPVALAFIKACGVPIAAPSANLSGRPSPTTAAHVYADLKDRCPLIIDGGPTQVGLESTVVDVEAALVLRPGGVTLEQLQKVVPEMAVFTLTSDNLDMLEKPPTPGLKYRHYSPNAPVFLLEGKSDIALTRLIQEQVAEFKSAGKSISLIHTRSGVALHDLENMVVIDLSSSINVLQQQLFSALRSLDAQGTDIIIVEGVPESNEGLAIMNRIRKAASKIILAD